jgi:hypothetical protein
MTRLQGYWQLFKAVALWPVREWNWRRWRKRTWRLTHTVVYQDRHGRTLTAPCGMVYDRFTLAPNLILPTGEVSDAAAIHDLAHNRGKWDDGSWMTFTDSVWAFNDIMFREGWPVGIRRLYHNGVSSDIARDAWNSHKDGRPRA